MLFITYIVFSLAVLSWAQTHSSSLSSSLSSSSSLFSSRPFTSSFSALLGHRPYHRVECRNPFPTKSDIYPHGVVLSGRIDDVRPAEVGGGSLPSDSSSADGRYMASVYVRRVIAGPRELRRQRVTITGFGDANKSWCHTNVRKGESWIFVLAPIANPDFFRLNGSLIRMTLPNIEKIDSIVAGESFTKHRTVIELPCEKKYCENNGNCVPDEYSADGARCECIKFCKPTYAPVCGSNGETYNNECELRMRSCLMKKNLFVQSTSPCSLHTGSVASQYHRGASGYTKPSTDSSSRPQHRHRPAGDRRSHHRNTITTTTTSRTQSRQY